MKVGENMFQMTLNKHAKFHGDRTIGSAITVKKASKHSISKVNDLKSMQYYSLDTLDQLLSINSWTCVCVCFCEPVVHFRCVSLSAMNQGWPRP